MIENMRMTQIAVAATDEEGTRLYALGQDGIVYYFDWANQVWRPKTTEVGPREDGEI